MGRETDKETRAEIREIQRQTESERQRQRDNYKLQLFGQCRNPQG